MSRFALAVCRQNDDWVSSDVSFEFDGLWKSRSGVKNKLAAKYVYVYVCIVGSLKVFFYICGPHEIYFFIECDLLL